MKHLNWNYKIKRHDIFITCWQDPPEKKAETNMRTFKTLPVMRLLSEKISICSWLRATFSIVEIFSAYGNAYGYFPLASHYALMSKIDILLAMFI